MGITTALKGTLIAIGAACLAYGLAMVLWTLFNIFWDDWLKAHLKLWKLDQYVYIGQSAKEAPNNCVVCGGEFRGDAWEIGVCNKGPEGEITKKHWYMNPIPAWLEVTKRAKKLARAEKDINANYEEVLRDGEE